MPQARWAFDSPAGFLRWCCGSDRDNGSSLWEGRGAHQHPLLAAVVAEQFVPPSQQEAARLEAGLSPSGLHVWQPSSSSASTQVCSSSNGMASSGLHATPTQTQQGQRSQHMHTHGPRQQPPAQSIELKPVPANPLLGVEHYQQSGTFVKGWL